MLRLLTKEELSTRSFIIPPALDCIYSGSKLLVFFRQGLVSLLQFANEGLQMEAIMIGGVIALCDPYE